MQKVAPVKHDRRNRIREGSVLADIIIYTTAILLAFVCLYPVYYVLILSLSQPRAAATMQVYWWPKGLYLGGYAKIFGDGLLWSSYGNTILYAAGEMLLMLITCSTFAYALSCKQLKHRGLINAFVLTPMYFSGGTIPLFMMVMKYGLYNTPWALILTGGYSIWYIILVKSYFSTIPETLREAAKIDGANHYQIWWQIYLPVSKPILAVIALYTIVNVWNSWFNAALFLADQKLQPLQLYLRRILVQGEIDLTVELATAEEMRAAQENAISNSQLKYTVIIVSSLPMIIAYPFFQKYFVKGVMLGSLKE